MRTRGITDARSGAAGVGWDQASAGGPRGDCWRVGPNWEWTCATGTGVAVMVAIETAARTGNTGIGAGPELWAYGQVGSISA